MARHARVLIAGVPHHVTQRGNRRERVFFDPGDPAAYLSLLGDYSRRHRVEVIAYCLMPNHVHHVVVPATSDGLHRLFKSVHGQYAQRVNRMKQQKGHLWQGRYFSSPLDPTYFLNAIRYVELNPVRARIVERAEDYDWSSAAAHCGNRRDVVVNPIPKSSLLSGISNWSRWLAEGVADEAVATIRRHGCQNLPCGNTDFLAQLEEATGRRLAFCTHGGPRTPHPMRRTRANGG
jgi:REP-associated tyrosine transposase